MTFVILFWIFPLRYHKDTQDKRICQIFFWFLTSARLQPRRRLSAKKHRTCRVYKCGGFLGFVRILYTTARARESHRLSRAYLQVWLRLKPATTVRMRGTLNETWGCKWANALQQLRRRTLAITWGGPDSKTALHRYHKSVRRDSQGRFRCRARVQ